MNTTTAISSVSQAPVPAEVRKEGADAVRGYRAALEFEGMLLKQMLSEALPESPTGESGEEGGEEGSAFASGPLPVSLPETVAEAVLGAGGLGIAKDMYTSFEGAQ